MTGGKLGGRKGEEIYNPTPTAGKKNSKKKKKELHEVSQQSQISKAFSRTADFITSFSFPPILKLKSQVELFMNRS